MRKLRRPARRRRSLIEIARQPPDLTLQCSNNELEKEFWEYTHTDENSDRVGEFAIGTNIGVHDVIGNILQDEKIPGVHIAFGNPYGAHTGADWYSVTHIDVVGRDFDIWLDDRQIMRDGQVPHRLRRAMIAGTPARLQPALHAGEVRALSRRGWMSAAAHTSSSATARRRASSRRL